MDITEAVVEDDDECPAVDLETALGGMYPAGRGQVALDMCRSCK